MLVEWWDGCVLLVSPLGVGVVVAGWCCGLLWMLGSVR